jgi:hypothetical protein
VQATVTGDMTRIAVEHKEELQRLQEKKVGALHR